MKIGMMPAKLTHYLVNIASLLEDNKVIYDPFCGLGTTLFVSNWLGYDVFGSDINPTPAKQNLKWWQTTPYYNPSKKIYIFKQDILQFTPHRKRFLFDVTNVVSEGYLGPVLNHYIDLKKAQELENQVGYVYFEAIRRLFRLPQLENIVFTFPVYFLKNKSRYIFEKIYDKIKAEGYELEILPEIYKRAGQKVGRQIVKIFK
jgi:SAM-dependent methyltransferase